MKYNNIAYILFVLWLLTSCASKELKKVDNDLIKEDLKGEVVFVQTKHAFETSLEFNDNGMIVKRFTRLPEYDLYDEEEYIYSGNKIVKEIEYRILPGNGLMTYVGNYTYNKDSQQIKYERFDDDHVKVKEYKYSNNLLVEEIEKGKGYKTDSRYYYTKGILDSLIRLNKDFASRTQSKEFHYFNTRGKVAKYIYINYEGDTLINLRKYNDKDLVSEFKRLNKDEDEIDSISYEYDSVGNWIKKYADGKLDAERFIYYKGSDYSSKIADLIDYKMSVNNKLKKNKNLDANTESYQENTTPVQEPVQRQWVNCRSCHGQGVETCSYCGGGGKVKCGNCDGTGIWSYTKKTCVGCGGKGEKYCSMCSGKGTRGRCNRCDGRGQVQE